MELGRHVTGPFMTSRASSIVASECSRDRLTQADGNASCAQFGFPAMQWTSPGKIPYGQHLLKTP